MAIKKPKIELGRQDCDSAGAADYGEPTVTVIEATHGWRLIDWRELWHYRDLFYFLVWRDIKSRYAQTVLGIGWAVIHPVSTMVVFTLIFGRLVNVSSDGAPYAVFSYVAVVPWAYFSSAMTSASGSIVGATGILNKVYYPRLMMPLTPVLAKLVDFVIGFTLMFALMAWFRIAPTVWILTLPLLIALMMLSAAGLGMWATAMAVHYRDVRFALGFLVQFLMYGSPVVYPASLIPSQYRLLYGLNPMAGVIEGFRSAMLGTNPMPWDLLAVGSGAAVSLAITGAFYFRRRERIFADVA